MARAGQIGGGSTDVYNPPTVPRSPTKRERRILGGYNDVPNVPNPTPKVPQVPKPRITDSGDLLTPTAARPQQGRIVNAPQLPGASRLSQAPVVPGAPPATTAVTPTPPTTAAPEPTTTAAGNGAGAPPSTAAANPPETIAQSIDIIDNALKSATTPDQQAIGVAFMNRVLDVIDQAQSQWMQYAKQTLNQVDPATLNAIANLKQTVADQRTRLMDQLNRANLLQSGIMLEMEDRLNRNELNAQQSLLAKALSSAMQQFQSGLLGFLNQRIATARQFGLQGMQEQFQAGQNAADRRQQLFGDLVPYTLGPTPYQQQSLNQQRENYLAPYIYGPTPAQSAQIQQAQERINLDRQQNGVTAQNQHLQSLLDAWKASGVAPQGLEGLGVAAGTPYAPSQSTSGFNAQATNETLAAFAGLSPEQIMQNLQNQQAMRQAVNAGVDVSALWKLYEQKVQNQYSGYGPYATAPAQ